MKSEYTSNYTSHQINRFPFRKFIRKFYLQNIVRLNKGKAIDFGCGIGELLVRLPKGSLGLEINETSVRYCRDHNMNVAIYNPKKDNYKFSNLKKEQFGTFIMSHVLEHIEESENILLKIMDASKRLNIKRIIIVVPGYKGFLYDSTHKTFVDAKFLKDNNLEKTKYFNLTSLKYFPLNHENAGKLFTHNETVLVYDIKK